TREYNVDVGVFTPSHFYALYQPELFGTRLPGVALFLEGEPFPVELTRVIGRTDCTIINAYGPSEATMLCSTHIVNGAEDGMRVAIGEPLANVTLRIVNSKGIEQPIGSVGELWVEGPLVGSGYTSRA